MKTGHVFKTAPNGHAVSCERCGKTMREYVAEGRHPVKCGGGA